VRSSHMISSSCSSFVPIEETERQEHVSGAAAQTALQFVRSDRGN